MLPERAPWARRVIPGLCDGLSPLECHWQLCWAQPLHTHWDCVCKGLTRVVDTPGTAGKHCWHSWKKLLAQLAHACAQCTLPARMTFTPRPRFAYPEHNLTHTRALEFLEYGEARECPVPGILMSHPTPDVTWVPCTWSLPRNPPKCGSMGTLCAVPVNTTLVGPGRGKTCLPLLPPGLEDPSTQQGQSLPWSDAVEQSGHRQGWGT